MLTIFFSVCMAEIAHLEKRRGLLWGAITFAISAVIQTFLIQGYWGAVLGFLVSYGAMTYMNFRHPVNKGVMQNNEPQSFFQDTDNR